MSNESVLKALADELKTQRELYADQIATGMFDKIEQYREAVGVIRGIDIATSYIADFYHRMYREDDDVN